MHNTITCCDPPPHRPSLPLSASSSAYYWLKHCNLELKLELNTAQFGSLCSFSLVQAKSFGSCHNVFFLPNNVWFMWWFLSVSPLYFFKPTMKDMVICSPGLNHRLCLLLPLQITSFLMLAFSLFSHGYLHDHEEVSTRTHTRAAAASKAADISAKPHFGPHKVTSCQLGKVQNARMLLSVIVKLSHELIHELMTFTPSCVPVEWSQCLRLTGRIILQFRQTFSKTVKFCWLKWPRKHKKFKFFLQEYFQFLQKYSFLSVKGQDELTNTSSMGFLESVFPKTWRYFSQSYMWKWSSEKWFN